MAATLGLTVVLLDTTRLLLVALALVIVAVGFGARKGLTGRTHGDLTVETVTEARQNPEVDSFRVPRFFYYLGLLFIGQLTFRLPLGLTLSDWFFFLSLITAIPVALSSRGRPRRTLPRTAVWTGVFLFSIGGLVSSLGAANSLSSLAILIRFIYITVVWFVLGVIVLVRREHVHRAVWLWVISIAVTGLGAIAQFFFGDVIPSTATHFGRMTGFTQHVNDLGGATSIALAPAVAFAVDRSTAVRVRIAGALCSALIGAGLILSGSVGGMLAAAVAILVLLTSGRSAGRLLFLAGAMGLLLILILGPASGKAALSPVSRFAEATGGAGAEKDSLRLRLEDYRVAWERIQDRPLIGVGLGPDNGAISGPLQVHNMILGPWYEAGALAAAGMVVILFALARMARRGVQFATNANEWRLVVALSAALVALLSFGLGAPVLIQRYGWIAAALLLAVRAQQDIRPPLKARRPVRQ
ncbi:MAG: O-antigen ligase family protein [Actinobacteria bacterium]|nr:O-antigen ligase family protein [Actinomycetota bacterium]